MCITLLPFWLYCYLDRYSKQGLQLAISLGILVSSVGGWLYHMFSEIIFRKVHLSIENLFQKLHIWFGCAGPAAGNLFGHPSQQSRRVAVQWGRGRQMGHPGVVAYHAAAAHSCVGAAGRIPFPSLLAPNLPDTSTPPQSSRTSYLSSYLPYNFLTHPMAPASRKSSLAFTFLSMLHNLPM